MIAISLLWRITYWIYVQDILSLSAACGALLVGLYIHTPIPWEHLLLVAVGGLGTLAVIFWFILSVQT